MPLFVEGAWRTNFSFWNNDQTKFFNLFPIVPFRTVQFMFHSVAQDIKS